HRSSPSPWPPAPVARSSAETRCSPPPLPRGRKASIHPGRTSPRPRRRRLPPSICLGTSWDLLEDGAVQAAGAGAQLGEQPGYDQQGRRRGEQQSADDGARQGSVLLL